MCQSCFNTMHIMWSLFVLHGGQYAFQLYGSLPHCSWHICIWGSSSSFKWWRRMEGTLKANNSHLPFVSTYISTSAVYGQTHPCIRNLVKVIEWCRNNLVRLNVIRFLRRKCTIQYWKSYGESSAFMHYMLIPLNQNFGSLQYSSGLFSDYR